MVQEVKPQEVNVDERALQVFLKAIDLVGGPRGLVEHKRLTWLPSLMEAAYAIVLREEGHKTTDEIAQFLGLSTNATRLILGASTENVQERLEGETPENETTRAHVAGGLAKLAYQALKNEET
ncbi:MAG TPA: regulator [Bacteroidetes bacterium]|nr:regulator [Bacteroidota bacterium]